MMSEVRAIIIKDSNNFATQRALNLSGWAFLGTPCSVDAFLILDLRLDVGDRIRRLDFERDGFPHKGFDEYLHIFYSL
jgi:hypothetical protein